ncbi:formimidoylglutamase [Corynebacterium timonense]|uniref:Formimidoylglutamase n=1 Tax=Corynebacterium timonense TaxID=441500 RepID=A0A1H1V2Z3_9CORY|nr:formimidoylglutamase [Corynebacterium timonense]SDS79187.1 formiminoglutamase [Corynebacterium timonense]
MAELFTPATAWSGRDDGPGPQHARWHSVIDTSNAGRWRDAVALLGFASDEGVARNGGRPGAAAGPEALRAALGGLAVHHPWPLVDAGTVTTQGEDLEGAQAEVSARVRELAVGGNLVVVLGGGHETSFATHRGVVEALGPLQVINFDAHFDLRQADRPTSGTPFRQIAELVGDDFDYSVFGISEPNNTPVLFDAARDLGVRTVLDVELAELSPRECARAAASAVAGSAPIHLSIDLDVLPAAVAPGVSAPAGFGVAAEKLRAMVTAVAATGRVALVDVVELNPQYDVDNRTAKVAARLIHDIVDAHVRAVAAG